LDVSSYVTIVSFELNTIFVACSLESRCENLKQFEMCTRMARYFTGPLPTRNHLGLKKYTINSLRSGDCAGHTIWPAQSQDLNPIEWM
jgi:hypothetical protein